MELQHQAQWLRGFLDSMSNSDSISKRQIEILSSKLEQLIISIEDSESIVYTQPMCSEGVIADDLPF